ncbi:hypothetical protein LTR91_001035 [Friedmanniomyces endolithicus]|uniref:Helicase ATP-binding domain-containing protein n=1 Tax=Friedmanniomyces endolithicus TaxID=329885 RepID=A0AAN6L3Q7_9PEZI|nr:hypothetical protein LTR57_010038 [Friedmanniomyces endolithicus]KAK1011468.1 hypothetical protein LTS01_001324 [Friedmanniomyces endolithicus]KAK1014172.1 hypothetical protein LTR91_001035 [Friedmanniomyces endolithicus]
MAPTLPSRKRKAAERSKHSDAPFDSDSDCIIIASATSGPQPQSKSTSEALLTRAPLEEVNLNKRQRTLQYVRIPRVEAVLSDAAATTPRHDVSESPSSTDEEMGDTSVAQSVQVPRIKKANTSSFVQSSLSAFLSGPAVKPPSERHGLLVTLPKPDLKLSAGTLKDRSKKPVTTSRPRRSTTRTSYAKESALEASTDDEPDRSGKRLGRGLKARRKSYDDDGEYGAEVESSSADEREGEDAEDVQSDEDDADVASEASLEEELPKAAKGKASKAANSSKAVTKRSPVTGVTGTVTTKANSGMRNLNRKGTVKGLELDLPPLSDTFQIFEDMTTKALTLGLGEATKHLTGTPLRIATMCSGTESPLLALLMVQDALKEAGVDTIAVEHVFSAEIVPFKQAYIERNFAPPIIFRDITEFTTAFESDEPVATTAYGARVPIPPADIVVAGTSCVDYSRQNAHRKGITDGGESGETWYGALAYCKAIRPKMIVFENVQSADWGSMLKHYRAIDYDCEGVFVDSKDYYIPHTRQRGYMICFDSRRLGKSGSSEGLGQRWQDLMDKFKRRASSSVSDFLLPADQVIMRQHTRDDEALREVDWAQCEIRQMQYRQSQGLGIARPVTHWLESGFMIVPERGQRAWFTRQVERVKDTIDCCILRTAVKDMYDPRFKTCVWDLSQNIERVHDASRGITGCILPTGIFFVSDANRILAAEETLMLQGIPLNRISFTTETQAELLDFAGNAMTSTVVGSALLAALIVGHKLIDPQWSPLDAPLSLLAHGTSERVSLAPIAQPSAKTVEAFTYRPSVSKLDVDQLLVLAGRAAQRCYCEGNDALCTKPLQECVDCHHTICITCEGNPVHNYHPFSNDDRLQPAAFTAQLKAQLPHQLSLVCKIPDIRAASVSASDNDIANLKSFQNVVKGIPGTVFSFQSIRRTHCWTVSYTAREARLDLSIDNGRAEWSLFATPGRDLAASDWLRITLRQPVAQATVSLSLFNVEWQWRVPGVRKLSLKLQGIGTRSPTWWARMELPAHLHNTQPQLLEVTPTGPDPSALERSLSGTYRYLPKCGKAADSLYCKIDPEQSDKERPIYLFWDPRPVGDSEEDVFVFSHDNSHLLKDEVRFVLAHIEAPWRPWPTTGKPVVPKIMADSTWVTAFESQLQARDLDLVMKRSMSMTVSENENCDQAKYIIGCHVQHQARDIDTTAGIVDVTKDAAFIAGHVWLFEIMQRQIELDTWHPISSDAACGSCQACAPSKPQLKWKLDTDKKTLKAYEDVSMANEYERAFKARTEPIVVTSARNDHGYTVNFGINVVSLAHRAAARLPGGSSNHDAVGQWKLDTSSGSSVLTSPKFKLVANTGHPPDVKLGMQVELFPNQRLVLAWMQKQEQGVDFFVEEAEEAVAKTTGWRAEVRISAPITVRGGICADHPGFGKTLTSLALVHAQYSEAGSSGTKISNGLSARRDETSPGLLVSSATVIVCPATLAQQWLDEIRDKIGSVSGVLTVFKITDLARYSIPDFQDAKIILVNRSILGSEQYAERLAAFAAVPGPATKTGGRAFSQWLRFANEKVPEHVRLLQGNGRDSLRQHIQVTYRQHMESSHAGSEASIPSRRLRGKDYVAAKGSKASQAQSLRAATSTVDTKEVDQPLFEMFYFNRLIVDEFHQYDPREHAAITALKADKRWGLSGTPALDDLYDVAQLASIIGVPLRTGSDGKGVMKARNIRAIRADMTDFERFEAMRALPSMAMHARLCEIHQLFLDTFVRRNVMDFAEMRYEDNLLPVTLDLDHRVMYTELSQHLNSLDMRIKRGKKSQATDRDERLYRAVNTSETAEEALSKTVAFLDRDTFDEASSGLVTLIQVREEQVSDTEKRLRQALSAAKQGEQDNLQKWKQMCLDDGSLQDGETIASIKNILTSARSHADSGSSTSKRKRSGASDEDLDEADGRAKPVRKNPLTSEVNTLSKRLVVAYRSLRYLHNVQRLQQHVTADLDPLKHCQAVNCHGVKPGINLAVSASCGHIVCKDCHLSLDQIHSTKCPAEGCSCSMQLYNLLWTSKMGDLYSTNPTPYGAKLESVVELLRNIRDAEEQAVLFVQYEEQMREVQRALEGHNLLSQVITDAGKAAAQINSFQQNRKCTVMVLNASDETAAGLNLQNANHVMFVSPLLRDSQYGYEATMAQAIGRVRRHGQKRPIFLHRIVALDTIDIDILEHRERRSEAVTESGSLAIVAPPTAIVPLEANGKSKRERCQLVKMGGVYSLQPHSWLCEGKGADGQMRIKGKSRVSGWEDFSSQLKFSRAYTEDDD